jgi:hypothetical protein
MTMLHYFRTDNNGSGSIAHEFKLLMNNAFFALLSIFAATRKPKGGRGQA